MSREAMQQALDMLNEIADEVYCDQRVEEVITALRQALETEQEPVAWISESENLLSWDKFYDHMKPLYTAPPKREWVGFTKEDMPDGDNPMFDTNEFYAGMAWAEAKLKEKNT